MTEVRYTHGHHDSVLRSHRWRTADNSASYLLPRLDRGMSLLDIGCGPGTITVDLAARLAPGRVVGIDASPEVLEEARSGAQALGTPGPIYEVGDVYALRFEDGSFDIVHAHQVLQHLGDPVAALREMRRVCRPGGIVAVRDADYPAMAYFPPNAGLDRARGAYVEMARANGANPDAGRKLLAWARRAGFASVVPSASVWCFATEEERSWWGGLWAERFTASALATQLRQSHIATDEDLAEFADGWRRWANEPDGWFAVLHGEVLCTV